MTWTTGEDAGEIFNGTFTKTATVKEYRGGLSTGDQGVLVKGIVHTFHGQTC
jgi:hypothetical protein